jgi:LPXTG-site transpeptidase (sortase) family protein
MREIVSMRVEKYFPWPYYLLLFLLLAGCGAPSASPTSSPTTTVSPVTPLPASTASSVPTGSVANPMRLLIPKINVDAPVEEVNITSTGELAAPAKNPWDGVGWYKTGPRPGEMGSAVIDGHLDQPGGSPAVFWKLSQLREGDSVIVMDAQKHTYRFRVTRVASYSPQNAPVQEIFGNSQGRYLNLITCAGTWIPSERQTTLRLVVYTSQVL